MKKRSIKRRFRKFMQTMLIVTLLVSLNINPIAMFSTVIIDTGIINKFSNLGKNLTYLAGKKLEEVHATEFSEFMPTLPNEPSGPVEVSIVNTPSSYFGTTENYLNWIMEYTGTIGNTENADSLYNIINDLYKLGSGYSQSTKIDADSPSYRDYGKSIAVHDEALTARLLGVNERDLSHVNAAQIEQLMQMGYDPRWINENGTIEEDFDKLIKATHEYSVANVYSLNNMIGGALWRPYSDEIPYIREFAEIVGGFANVYMGYWDTNVSTLKKPINSQRALEILGYDAILRYEGIQVLEPTKILENGVEAIFVPEVVGLQKYTESPVDRTITNDPDLHEDEVPDRDLTTSGRGGVPTGQSGVNENIILRQVEVSEDGTITYVKEDDIEEAIVPDSTIVQLYQEEIPNQDITWLDAVTVLYKALGQEQISYQTFTAYNPNLTPETSPLAKDLPGLTDFDGYNFYAFFTRSNPFSGDLETGSFQAIYWRKAINDGFVSYALRDEPISAEDFYMLAKRMMESYGEPEMSPDEMHTLLQIYGSYYPVQLGRTVADSWEYLKCRGILTEDNEPESFTSTLTRDQLLDICMRIKDVDSRITYKNMNLTIDVGEVLRDKDYFPVYDFDMKTEEDDDYAFISTTVNYESYDYYTYMFPVERSVNLGYSGCGLIYNKPEKSDENLIDHALYEGKKHIEGYDYYVIDVPKEYTGQIFLGFQNYDDPGSVKGTVDFIEVPNYCLGGGIYTAYEINESTRIATLVEPELGVSYFPFSSQSNNMELVYYCDIDRCSSERPVGSESPTVASLWDRFVDTWEYLTQPVEVLAAEDYDTDQYMDDANLITKVTTSSNYWKAADEYYGDSSDPIQLVNPNNQSFSQISQKAPGYVSALTRAAILCKYDLGVWDNTSENTIKLSSAGEAVKSQLLPPSELSWEPNPEISLGASITQALNNTDGPLYKKLTNRKAMIAFAAGIKPTDIPNIPGEGFTANRVDDDVVKALTYMKNQKCSWYFDISRFNSVSAWKDGDGYSKAIRTSYVSDAMGGYFEIASRGYEDSYILGLIGNANQHGTESGVIPNTDQKYFDIRSSLNSSVIMNKDSQILVCWDDLVSTGFAWGITDGKPKMSKIDGTYTFMTKNGMVKVNDDNHMIQIGTTLYTWTRGEIPNLVFIDDDQNMYLDIRCVTGVINSEITLMEGKAEILHNTYGAGKYAVYSISMKGASTSLYKTKTVSCYNFPDTTKTGGSGIASGIVFPTTLNTMDICRFDGGDIGTGDIYWGDDLEDGMRVMIADFYPTSNWILTITGEDEYYDGKLYVYYLKDAFLTDSFADGGSPPEPSGEWTTYWQDQIDEQKKRCEVNYDSVTGYIKNAMSSYRETVPGDKGWICDMTEAAMYSIAADTGTFWLSEDYAVRCFDLTQNSVVTQPTNTDFTKPVDAVGNDFRSNDPGAIYYMDMAGYIYNLPKLGGDDGFTLERYLSGEFPLPLINMNNREIWNMNMTWYGNTNNGTVIPYGCELTSDGYIRYDNFEVVIPASELPQRNSLVRTYNEYGGLTGISEENTYSEENTELPFYVTSEGESSTGGSFKPAPSAIMSRYGIFDSGINNTKISNINQNETKRNYYYLGNRVVCISDDFASKDASKIPFDFASSMYNPIALSSTSSDAHFVGQTKRPVTRDYYILNYGKIYEVRSAITSNSQEEHLATDDSYLWEGKAKLVAILNMIDRTTNWFMWTVFILVPMILIIVMTLLIGLSFITDNKIYLAFCEKLFDPVRLFTFGIRDSSNWFWTDVWRRATITYIAFALFANANILRIIIWAADGWMKITEALGF